MSWDDPLLSLLALPRETEWVEWKANNDNPEELGEYVSALSNSAALLGREAGFLVWGVEDGTRRIVGTAIDPRARKIGNEPFENWLAHNLAPRIDFQFREVQRGGLRILILRIQPAFGQPVRFKGTEWIRIGESKKKLSEHSGREKELWAALSHAPFETGIAAPGVPGDEVLAILDYPKFFELSGQVLPTNKAGIFERLTIDRLIVRTGDDRFDVTNLGGILFAKKLARFPALTRKAFRVVRYRGRDRTETEHEKPGTLGYAAGFEGLVGYVNDQVPPSEVLGEALRRELPMYPRRAIRELVANAMIHQDFSMTGTGPMVEIFTDRLEISNPGVPLIDPLRFIDHSPRSRNEILADLMRRLGICEERGSGFDKVIFDIEFAQLPAPDIRLDTHTRVILFAEQDPAKMDRTDRIRACYQHCCLLYVSNQRMTNSTLRHRFKLEEREYPVASRIIRDTITAGLVRLEDPTSKSKRHSRYVPFWA